jgi:hypothetical protein
VSEHLRLKLYIFQKAKSSLGQSTQTPTTNIPPRIISLLLAVPYLPKLKSHCFRSWLRSLDFLCLLTQTLLSHIRPPHPVQHHEHPVSRNHITSSVVPPQSQNTPMPPNSPSTSSRRALSKTAPSSPSPLLPSPSPFPSWRCPPAAGAANGANGKWASVNAKPAQYQKVCSESAMAAREARSWIPRMLAMMRIAGREKAER